MRRSASLRSLSAALALALGLLGNAQAGLVSAQLGNDDGFGLGVISGTEFFAADLADGPGLSEWHEGGFVAQLNAAWTGTLTGAQLQVFSGGWGLYGAAQVLLNGNVVGQLTVADFDVLGGNYAFLDNFDLGTGAMLVNGLNDLEIRVMTSADANDPIDSGVLGFAKLVLQTQDAGGGTVPEPASAALAAAALAGAALTRRRRRD